MFSIDDQRRLNLLKINRIKELLPVTAQAAVMLAMGDRPEVRIGCINASQVDLLLEDPLDLLRVVYGCTGILQAVIYFAGERIWCGSCSELLEAGVELGSTDDLEVEPMPATIAREKTGENGASSAPAPTLEGLKALSVADIVFDLNLEADTVYNWLKISGTPVMDFQGNLIISAEAARATYQHFWGESLNAVLTRRGLAQATPEQPKKEPQRTATTKTSTTRKKTSTAKRPTKAKPPAKTA